MRSDQALEPNHAILAVSPALEKYRVERIQGDLWKRPHLNPRDRSLVTIAFLVARNQPERLPFYLNQALDHGVKPSEISETLTHLAFYSGWENAMSAIPVVGVVFTERGSRLPSDPVEPLTLDEDAEEERAARVAENFGETAPGLGSVDIHSSEPDESTSNEKKRAVVSC